MTTRRWSDLDPRTQQAIMLATGLDAGLKAAALIDLARRPASEVRGSKARWAAVIAVVNSVGVIPVVYFLYGRR
jgi:hypothetical protein